MRWRAPSERVQLVILSPVIIPAAIALVVAALPLAAITWLEHWARNRFAPPRTWSWYAWRPVRINDWFDPNEGQWVWLERVERKRHCDGSSTYGTGEAA